MASLLNSFSQLMTPDTIGQLSRVVGVDGSQAQKGLDVIGPLVLGSLARKSETVTGMDSIMRLLPQETTGSLLGNLLGSAGRQAPGSTASLLTGVLGPGVSTIGKALGGRLGFDATPLLSVAAPAILGLISTTAKEQKLNSADIAKTLQSEHTATMASVKPEVQAVLTEAFRLSDKAEKLKATFTDDEWKHIRIAPLAATYYVASASPSGFTGLAKEVIAAGDTMKSLVKNALPTSLVDVAYGSFEGKLDLEKDIRISETAPRSGMLGIVRAAAQAVKAKSLVDAPTFGETIVAISKKVAEASKEGGILGIGGTRVSKEEEQAIAEISSAVA
ncbi:MAG TPA: DUF937 domain-containing protein [Vicinamibacterales bacterium]|jgi:hypothetical protein